MYPLLFFAVAQSSIMIAAVLFMGPLKGEPAKILFAALNLAVLLVALTIPFHFTDLLPRADVASAAVIVFRRLPTPIFYLFCVALLLPGSPWRRDIIRHIGIFAAFALIMIFFALCRLETQQYEFVAFSVVSLYKILYLLLIYRLVRKHKALLSAISSAPRHEHVLWIKIICSFMIISNLVLSYGLWRGRFWVDEANASLYALGLGFTSFCLFRSTRFFTHEVSALSERNEKKPEAAKPNTEELQKIADRLRYLMREERLYRKADLTLSQLAQEVGCRPYLVSQALSACLKTSFFEFVNRYRIEEAVYLLDRDRTQQVIQIAYQVGFNSKSSFNTAFKRFVSKSPTAYRSDIGSTSLKSDDVTP